jgi:uncharacterized RDD family membrane protein YckC
MSTIIVPTSFNIDLEFNIPSFSKRLLAWVIDMAIILIYSFTLQMTIASNVSRPGDSLAAQYNISFLTLILYTPVLIYHLVCEIFMNGQSIGKKLTGIQVISEDGKRPAVHQFLIRWLLRLVDMMLTFGFSAFILSITTRKAQRLGDLAAGTLVIDRKRATSLTQTLFFEVSDQYVPRYPAVLQLSDRDMNTIKSAFESCKRTSNYEYARKVGDKIRQALNIREYQEDEIDFLETILTDYNYLSTRD